MKPNRWLSYTLENNRRAGMALFSITFFSSSLLPYFSACFTATAAKQKNRRSLHGSPLAQTQSGRQAGGQAKTQSQRQRKRKYSSKISLQSNRVRFNLLHCQPATGAHPKVGGGGQSLFCIDASRAAKLFTSFS